VDALWQYLTDRGMSDLAAAWTLFGGVLVVAIAANLLARLVLIGLVHTVVLRSRTTWDDALVRHKVIRRLSHLLPAVIVYWAAPLVFVGNDHAISLVRSGVHVYLLLVAMLLVDALLKAVHDVYQTLPISRRMPILIFLQVGKIVAFVVLGLLIVAVLIKRDLGFLLGGMGAMMAVVMLIFRDAILGFVAGITLSANKMVHVGDWISMPAYGADGDVIEIGLTTVKVQNWDKTITTIPTYALIGESFKNWRGMSESGGRRIKRSIHLDMNSVRFCTREMLDRYKKVRYIQEYLDAKEREVAEHNARENVDESTLVNGRHLTNLGTFRAYLQAYLQNHPMIHQEMTLLVRHLQPTEHGLPIEVYAFSRDQAWANYEGIQADIFDHVLAVIPQFDLRVYQQPSGLDFQTLSSRTTG
jgi:miniconductance mechanosensitive channel